MKDLITADQRLGKKGGKCKEITTAFLGTLFFIAFVATPTLALLAIINLFAC